jgi:tRNA threonylcarbamoyladenosine biosynthesis protein TsaB
MLILAIDTALEACAVAVLDTATGVMLARESQTMARGHAEALMPMIDRVITAAATGFAALDRIAVSVGPGSFTGLRVGIAAARGLGLAAGKPVVGVTTLSAYAAPEIATDDATPILSAIDARHDQVYFQIVSSDGEVLVAPTVRPIAEALAAADALAPRGSPRLVGNAADLLAARWPANLPPPTAINTRPAPEIDWVGWLGAAADPDHARPRPFYLRAPDAKPQANPQAQLQTVPPLQPAPAALP